MGELAESDSDRFGPKKHAPPGRCGWFWERVYSEDDSALQVLRKRTLCVMGLSMLFPTLAFILVDLFTLDAGSLLHAIGLFIALFGELYSLYLVFGKRHVANSDITVLAVFMGLGVIIIDWSLRGMGKSFWFMMVVCLDALLVVRAPRTTLTWLRNCTVAWLVLSEVESFARFGLWDIAGSPTQANRQTDFCGCDTLPCAQPASRSLGDFTVAAITVVLTYHMTLSFVDKINQEKEKTKRALQVAEDVAEKLAAFDLIAARERLDAACEEGSLSAPFYDVFENLLNNLAGYRPYLPVSLLGGCDERDEADSDVALAAVAPPGLVENQVAIMFTDIRASTRVWALCPDGMKKALKQHDRCLRQCIARRGGYEVKTIGDAFMVAFPALADAVQCGLDIQQSLMDVEWPEALLAVPECAKEPNGLWGGLALRIGVDCGEVEPELNALTQRYDYFGETVNRASRLEAQCAPGAVAGRASLMEEALDELDLPCDATQDARVELKGFDGSVAIRVAMPAGLEGRWGLSHGIWSDMARRSSLRARSSIRSRSSDSDASAASPVSMRSPRVRLESSLVVGVFQEEPMTAAALEMRVPHNGVGRSALAEIVLNAQQCLDATSGTILTTLGTVLAARWSGRGGMAHREAAARFVAMFRHRSVGGGTCPVHIGVATGAAAVFTVGSAQQRFITCLGPCVDYAMRLAKLAEAEKVNTLYTAGEAHPEGGVRSMQAGELRRHPTSLTHEPFSGAPYDVAVYELVVDADCEQGEEAAPAKEAPTSLVSPCGSRGPASPGILHDSERRCCGPRGRVSFCPTP
eukprot:TRINITY_DN2261_c1_g3_i1.p1 TRINITY_DN2261_c1_g3~~TRINITY_DN2261_c1_g3_i1.p1  ORF type:complete len:807 (+),score=233.15 TRINITY_DN2261_c1_g3_i1:84-2504(+)